MNNKLGFLKERTKLEFQRARYEISVTSPMKLMLELTNICNHRCVFCANSRMTRPKGCISLTLAERVIAQAAEMGVKELSLVATGEPFASPDIDMVIRLAKKYKFTYVYATTNGGLATTEKLKSAIEAGLDSLQFSFNAGTRDSYLRIHGHDDFEKVIRRIEEIAQYRRTSGKNFLLGISFIVTKDNREEKPLVEKLFADIVDDIAFREEGNQAGHHVQNNKTWVAGRGGGTDPGEKCYLPFTTANVTYEGYLTMCCVDFQNYLVVADLNVTSLFDAWNSAQMQSGRKKLIEQKTEGTLCHRCLTGKQQSVEPLIPKLATIDNDVFQ